MIEAIISLGLILMAMGAFAKVASSYGAVDRKVRDKDAMLETTLLGIQRLAGDLKAATRLLSPTSGTSSVLRFERVDPTAAYLPAIPDPDNEVNPFDPFTANTGTVEYTLVDRDLVRTWTPPSGPVTSGQIAGQLNGFAAEYVGPQEIRVRLTILDGNSTRTITRPIYLTSTP